MVTPPTLKIALKNATLGDEPVFAHITGLDLSRNPGCPPRPFILQADGKTGFWPDSPRDILQPLGKDCAIRLGGGGVDPLNNTDGKDDTMAATINTTATTTMVTIPRIAGGRIWFSLGKPLTFLLNPGANGAAAFVEPSATNPSDPNYFLPWSFAEFTYNENELFINVSYVDFVSLPIGLEVIPEGGGMQEGDNSYSHRQTVPALPNGGLVAIAKKLEEQDGRDGKGWSKLVMKKKGATGGHGSGEILRVMSPNAGRMLHPGLFAEYYAPYVDSVWGKYRGEDLVVDTQHSVWGKYRCRVDAQDDKMHCYSMKKCGSNDGGKVGSFSKPRTEDVFSCSTGPFAPPLPPGPGETTPIMLNLGARIAAALNRSTLLANGDQPQGEKVEKYYYSGRGGGSESKGEWITNHYARACHDTTLEGKGYAFPYDDVASSGGNDQSGFIQESRPKLLTVILGRG